MTEKVKSPDTEYQFTKNIKGVVLPTDTFLEKLRESLSEQGFSCKKSSDVTGNAITLGTGLTLGGEVGTGVASSHIITNSWNPFILKHPANWGAYEGVVKVSEMAKYNKKEKGTTYELRDYQITGSVKFVKSFLTYFNVLVWGILVCIFSLLFLILAITSLLRSEIFKFVIGLGLFSVLSGGTWKYYRAHNKNDIKIPKTKIEDAVSKLQNISKPQDEEKE